MLDVYQSISIFIFTLNISNLAKQLKTRKFLRLSKRNQETIVWCLQEIKYKERKTLQMIG
jgi:exonuclease III